MSRPKCRICLLCGRRARAMKKVDGEWVCRNTTKCVMRRCEIMWADTVDRIATSAWMNLGRIDGEIHRPVVRFYDAEFNEVKGS